MTHFDLRRLKLRSGEEWRGEVELVLEPLELGAQRYLPVPDKVPAELVVTRASTGTLFGLAFGTRLHGPCVRCLDDAVLEISIAAREYQATQPGESDELRTEYVADDRLDLSQWARDAIALAWHRDRYRSPAARAFVETALEVCAELQAEAEAETGEPMPA